MRDTLPLLVGAIPFGILYGALAVTAGLSLPATLAMSLIVFAGLSLAQRGGNADSRSELIPSKTIFKGNVSKCRFYYIISVNCFCVYCCKISPFVFWKELLFLT